MAKFFKTVGQTIWIFIKLATAIILKVLSSLCGFVFGRFDWTPPFWLRQFGRGISAFFRLTKRHVKASLITGFSLLVLLVGGGFLWHWYDNRPIPEMVSYKITEPNYSNYDSKPPRFDSVAVVFSKSVAPLENINKPIVEGISLKPDVPGKWHWANDKALLFVPENDWPADTTYQINFDKKKLFAVNVLLKDYQSEFTTKSFLFSNTTRRLYEDPTAPMQKKVIMTLRATHPIDQADFAKRVSVSLSKGLQYLDKKGQNLPQIFYSENGREAYIHSAMLDMPLEPSDVTIKVVAGARAQVGGTPYGRDEVTVTKIPGRYQLSFNEAEIKFINNIKGQPEPALFVTSSMAVDDAVLAQNIEAWQLPLRDPEYPNLRWLSNEVTEEVLKQAMPTTLTPIEGVDDNGKLHAYKITAKPNAELYVQVKAHVESKGGYLSRDKQLVYLSRMPNYPKTLAFLSDGALLSLNGERHVAISARGVKGASVEIARILPKQLHHLVSRLDGRFTRPDMGEQQFDELVERANISVFLPQAEPNELVYASVDLSPYLNYKDGRRGIFVLRVNEDKAYDRETLGDVNETRDYRFIVVTDLGIISKGTSDGGNDIFVQSIATGAPVDNALVEVYGVNGLPLAQAYTDGTGHVRFEYLGELNREKRPLMYVVSKDNDQSFLPVANQGRELDLSRFAIDGLVEEGAKDLLRAYLFTERGLYRPGETVHLGMVVRAADWSGQLNGLPVKLEISDPRGKTIRTETLKLNREAFMGYDFESTASMPAGTYTAQLSLPDDVRKGQSRFLGSVNFSIRDFEPDRMKVTASLHDGEVKGWVKPQDVKAEILAMHLFGAPASDRRVALTMDIEPTFIGFDGYRDYRFYLSDQLKDSFHEELSDQETDESGKAHFDLQLNRFTASAYDVQILSRVFEAGSGRNVAADARILVSNEDYMIGVKNTDPLDYIMKDSDRFVDWAAIDPQLKKVAVDHLTRELIEIRYVSVLVKQRDNTYAYKSQRKDVLVEAKPFAIGENGLHDKLKTDEPGRYIVNIKRGGQILNQIEYYVAGDANASRSLDRNAELQLKLNKTSYAPGEMIAVSINAPYTGSGLITIERDKVYAHAWFKADTTSSIQYIRLPQGLEGNAYINVQFVRSPSSDEIFMSPLSYAVKPFSISLDARRTEVALETPKTVEPGNQIPIKLTVNRPTKVVVWGVDEGILQVARYNQPQPLEYFFKKRALEVSTAQILDLILPEFSQLLEAAATGGDDEGALTPHLNPFKRKNKPPVVYWSGIISVPAGQTTLEWTAPDYFNGKVHFFAVAVDDNHIGITQNFTESRGAVVMTPNLPPFVAPGDKIRLSAGIFSNLDQNATIHVALESADKTGKVWQLQEAKPADLAIDSKREKTAYFTVVAGDQLGAHDLEFVATLPDGKVYKMSESISIRPAAERRVRLETAVFTGKEHKIALTRTLYPQYGKVSAGAASSPLVWATGLRSYLDNYGYICTEQSVSKAMPDIVLSNPQDVAAVEKLQKTLALLQQRSNSEGGFGFWAATPESDVFASLYAADFMIEAKSRGFQVPEERLKSVNKFLMKIADEAPADGLDGARLQAYAISLLTRQGIVTTNQLSALRERLETYFEEKDWHNSLAATYMAASYKMMKQDKEANRLIDKQGWLLQQKSWKGAQYYYDDTLSHDAELIHVMARHFPDRLQNIPQDVFVAMGTALQAQRYNSLSSALLIRALARYEASLAAKGDVISLAATIGEKEILPLMMTGQPPVAPVPLDALFINAQKNEAKTLGFMVLNEAGYDREIPKKPVVSGIEVFHDYVDAQGNHLDKINVGDEFFVRIRLRGIDKNVDNVAIVDLLPGGVELVYRQPDLTQNESDDQYDDEGEEGNDAYALPPIGEAAMSDWQPSFIDPRDDRVILYGWVYDRVQTFTYRVRAINAGEFITPASYAESMYEPTIHGQGVASKLIIHDADEQLKAEQPQ